VQHRPDGRTWVASGQGGPGAAAQHERARGRTCSRPGRLGPPGGDRHGGDVGRHRREARVRAAPRDQRRRVRHRPQPAGRRRREHLLDHGHGARGRRELGGNRRRLRRRQARRSSGTAERDAGADLRRAPPGWSLPLRGRPAGRGRHGAPAGAAGRGLPGGAPTAPGRRSPPRLRLGHAPVPAAAAGVPGRGGPRGRGRRPRDLVGGPGLEVGRDPLPAAQGGRIARRLAHRQRPVVRRRHGRAGGRAGHAAQGCGADRPGGADGRPGRLGGCRHRRGCTSRALERRPLGCGCLCAPRDRCRRRRTVPDRLPPVDQGRVQERRDQPGGVPRPGRGAALPDGTRHAGRPLGRAGAAVPAGEQALVVRGRGCGHRRRGVAAGGHGRELVLRPTGPAPHPLGFAAGSRDAHLGRPRVPPGPRGPAAHRAPPAVARRSLARAAGGRGGPGADLLPSRRAVRQPPPVPAGRWRQGGADGGGRRRLAGPAGMAHLDRAAGHHRGRAGAPPLRRGERRPRGLPGRHPPLRARRLGRPGALRRRHLVRGDLHRLGPRTRPLPRARSRRRGPPRPRPVVASDGHRRTTSPLGRGHPGRPDHAVEGAPRALGTRRRLAGRARPPGAQRVLVDPLPGPRPCGSPPRGRDRRRRRRDPHHRQPLPPPGAGRREQDVAAGFAPPDEPGGALPARRAARPAERPPTCGRPPLGPASPRNL
ncbi:MAG: hypothetical protein AVDCRST_MAG20-2058, partial [uncultured Acidimicrobiales bacterium]